MVALPVVTVTDFVPTWTVIVSLLSQVPAKVQEMTSAMSGAPLSKMTVLMARPSKGRPSSIALTLELAWLVLSRASSQRGCAPLVSSA